METRKAFTVSQAPAHLPTCHPRWLCPFSPRAPTVSPILHISMDPLKDLSSRRAEALSMRAKKRPRLGEVRVAESAGEREWTIGQTTISISYSTHADGSATRRASGLSFQDPSGNALNLRGLHVIYTETDPLSTRPHEKSSIVNPKGLPRFRSESLPEVTVPTLIRPAGPCFRAMTRHWGAGWVRSFGSPS